jgi:hypothetical protein
MLQKFFQLNSCDNLKCIDSAEAFAQHFHNASSLKNSLVTDRITLSEGGLKDIELENVQLSKVIFERFTFTRCRFVDCILVGTTFNDCQFHQCSFRNCNTYKFNLKNVYIDPRSFQLDRRYHWTASNIGVDLFQTLYRNASETYQTYFASFADIKRRRWRRYQSWYDIKENRTRRISALWQIFSDVCFDLTMKYGYGPLRFLLISSVLFITMPSLGQHLWDAMGMMRASTPIPSVTLSDALYYCMLLVTTLGFSDLVPTTQIGKMFAVGCALFGISWMALFTAILVKRVIR